MAKGDSALEPKHEAMDIETGYVPFMVEVGPILPRLIHWSFMPQVGGRLHARKSASTKCAAEELRQSRPSLSFSKPDEPLAL